MNSFKSLLILLFLISSCQSTKTKKNEITIAFGSCNNQTLENKLWKEIEKHHPLVWIWGGDVIYSDTDDMQFLEHNYMVQKNNPEYQKLIKNVDVLATWDDHDYGLNDGGLEYSKKEESQQLFLDFIDVPKKDIRRKQEGIYYSKDFTLEENSVKILVLDTRYFRTALTADTLTTKRYTPNKKTNGTMLGKKQWDWLENELTNSKCNFNIVVSSIQFLSSEHGFETWGNMPNEVDKFEKLVESSKAKNVIILSGDRHISEISKKEILGLSYPLIDFTSSGMTHSYSDFKNEPNKYRIGKVVSNKSFGILKINFELNTAEMELRGEKNTLLTSFIQKY